MIIVSNSDDKDLAGRSLFFPYFSGLMQQNKGQAVFILILEN